MCIRDRESIFTGTNNFVSDSVADSRLTEYFGFVQSEVDEILKDAHILNQSENMRKWYDGYHFGDVDVYCPWDVMNYVLDLQRKPDAKPLSYWRNTSDNAIIRSFIDYAGSSITPVSYTHLDVYKRQLFRHAVLLHLDYRNNIKTAIQNHGE